MHQLRALLIITLFTFPLFTSAADVIESPCWADEDYLGPVTSNLAMLKTFQLPIRFDQPESDAAIRHAHGDFRFMTIGGYTSTVPGLDKFKDDKLICRYGTRFVEGTTDNIQVGEHAELIGMAFRYAKSFNLEMLRLLGETEH